MQHDNSRPYVFCSIKNYLELSGWEVQFVPNFQCTDIILVKTLNMVEQLDCFEELQIFPQEIYSTQKMTVKW